MCKQKHGHAEGLKLDLNLIFDMTNFNDDIFWNDRTKSLVGLGTMLFVRLSMDRQGLCKYRNAFQLPWPAWGIVGTDIRGICLTISSHHCISSSIAASICFFSISMSLNWHYQFHYSPCARLASRDLWCYGVLSDSSSLKQDTGTDALRSVRVKVVLCLQAQVNTTGRKCATSAYQKLCTRETVMLAVL